MKRVKFDVLDGVSHLKFLVRRHVPSDQTAIVWSNFGIFLWRRIYDVTVQMHVESLQKEGGRTDEKRSRDSIHSHHPRLARYDISQD